MYSNYSFSSSSPAFQSPRRRRCSVVASLHHPQWQRWVRLWFSRTFSIDCLEIYVQLEFLNSSCYVFFFPRQHQYLSTYGLNFLLRGLPTRTWSYFNSSIRILRYDDLTKFEYTLITANRVEIFANTGRNTHILFQFGNKLKIYAKDNESITYSLSFEIDSHANFIANYIVSTKSARYKVSKPLCLHDLRISNESH